MTGTATVTSSEGSTGLYNRGIVVRVPAGNFSPLSNARPHLGYNQPPIQQALEGSATGAKLTALELRQIIVWSNTYTALRLHDLYRDNCTITCTMTDCAVHEVAAWLLDTLLQNFLSTGNSKLLECLQV